MNSSEICDPGFLDYPLDEEVQFRAKVMPSTETVLRFIWQLGVQDIRRINIPVFSHKYQQAGWFVLISLEFLTTGAHCKTVKSSFIIKI